MSGKTHTPKIRQKLEQMGTLHWFHWLIILLSLLLTVFAWYVSKQQVQEKIKSQFDRQAQQTIELVLERVQLYGEALWAGVAMMQAEGGDTDFNTWRKYVDNLNLMKNYPGINGIGVIHHIKRNELPNYLKRMRRQRADYRIYPKHSEKDLLPISYIIPVKGNEKAVGLDMAHEANRYRAALKARATGTAQITGPIVLVQDDKQTPGFLFYAPFYKGGTYSTVAEREKHFMGLVYAPFIVRKLMNGVLDQHKRQIAIEISDDKHLLYSELEKDNSHYDPNPLFKMSKQIPVYGRIWTFNLASDKSFTASVQNNQPLTILFGGIIIDSLLLLLFITISRSSKQTLNYADDLTKELKQKTTTLEASNRDLNRFAYITSHDLRAPLRAIENLVQWILEDDAENLSGESQKRLKMVRSRISRMNGLINGILDYSRAGNLDRNHSEINLNDLVREIIDGIGKPQNIKLIVKNPLPTIRTNATALGQVFSNLIVNAVKYNDKEQAIIELDYRELPQGYEFSIRDNGPGISPEFHDKVFELFQTLKPKDVIESSGVGLALIKKTVEAANGEINLESQEGQGCTFTFTWLNKN